MGDVIDMSKFTKKDDGHPDPNHIYVDEDGVQWFIFSCCYTDRQGREMSFRIWALSHEDAAERIQSIKDSVKIDGQLILEIDA